MLKEKRLKREGEEQALPLEEQSPGFFNFEPKSHMDEMQDIWERAVTRNKHKGDESPRASLISASSGRALAKTRSKPLEKIVHQMHTEFKKSQTIDLANKLKAPKKIEQK